MQKEIEVNEYLPGTCNIGPDEVRRRYRIGFIGLFLMIVYILFVKWLDLPDIYKLGLFIPAFYCVSGFLQAIKKFCFVYGWRGLSSLSGMRKFQTIKGKNFLKQDRRTAINFVLIVTFCSIVLTAIYYSLPI
jgi:hypothetical protein